MAFESLPAREGFATWRGFRTWYRVVGERGKASKCPIICIHGGPGEPHDYFEPLSALALGGREVVFYDQIGCGASDHPSDASPWTVDLFLEELRALIRALGFERAHLLGDGWGAMLALEHVLRKPGGIASLTLLGPTASVPRQSAEANRLRAALPAHLREALRRHESADTTDDPEYEAATGEFRRRHLCRLSLWPDCLNRTLAGRNPEVHRALWGTSAFLANGTLRDWDVTDRLGEIRAPTLIASGRYDLATPSVVEQVYRRIASAEWVVFPRSAHLPWLEEPERFLAVADEFLGRAERLD